MRPGTARRHGAALVALLAAALAVCGPWAAAASPTPSPEAQAFRFGSLNRTYSMNGATVAPIRQGPLTIHLSSPHNVLVVQKNLLELQPLGDGTYRSHVSIDLLGSGDLVARFDTGTGAGEPMDDRVVLPPQTIDLEGRIKFDRVPAGWEVTALSLPPQTEVKIQSRVVTSLVNLCEQLSAFLGLECGGLQTSLTQVAVPLPKPGSVFLLQESDLTPAEVQALDAYLGTGIP